MRATKARFEPLVRRVDEVDTVDLVTRLSLILLVYSDWVTSEWWPFRLLLVLMAIAGLALPPLHRSPALWTGVAVAMVLKTTSFWWTQDNHLFVLTWWSVALALSLNLVRPRDALAHNARLLIGLSFAFATLWKGALSPDFVDGTYFEYTFLTDRRFAELAYLGSDVPDRMLEWNRQELTRLVDSGVDGVELVVLQSTHGLATLARLVTGWTLVIELTLAVLFLWPHGRGFSRWRHAVLLVFCSTTYLVANVATFAWTLLILGLAQCELERRGTRALYFTCLLLVMVYDYVSLPAFASDIVACFRE